MYRIKFNPLFLIVLFLLSFSFFIFYFLNSNRFNFGLKTINFSLDKERKINSDESKYSQTSGQEKSENKAESGRNESFTDENGEALVYKYSIPDFTISTSALFKVVYVDKNTGVLGIEVSQPSGLSGVRFVSELKCDGNDYTVRHIESDFNEKVSKEDFMETIERFISGKDSSIESYKRFAYFTGSCSDQNCLSIKKDCLASVPD